MNFFLSFIVAAVLGYFLGSINSAIIVVRMFTGKDIRDMGSKNAGLTNTLRCAGKHCAVLTLVGDLLKGIVAVLLSRGFCHLVDAGLSPDNDTHYIGYIAGFFAILGHVFPLYYGFKGGKGVLVSAASLIAIDYKVLLASLLVFIVVLAISKYVSLGSLISSAYCPLATFLMSWIVDDYSLGRSLLYMFMCMPMMAMIIWMHRTNMQRLKDGNENKFSFKPIKMDKE